MQTQSQPSNSHAILDDVYCLIIINLSDYDLVLSGIIDLNLRNINQTAIMKCDYFHIICGTAEPLLHYLYSA